MTALGDKLHQERDLLRRFEPTQKFDPAVPFIQNAKSRFGLSVADNFKCQRSKPYSLGPEWRRDLTMMLPWHIDLDPRCNAAWWAVLRLMHEPEAPQRSW